MKIGILFFLSLSPCVVSAAEPVLYFSDIISGPKTGLGDGKGSGAIVTVWGVNLGSTQGGSQISIGGVPAAYVYYWGNADTTGASGPADLYAYHKMQTISFSVPAAVADGATTIAVSVNGVQSNALPFTIRAGRILFIKTTGTDSSSGGSWSSPWKTIPYVLGGAVALAAGDTLYVADDVTEAGGATVRYINGTAAAPISLIAYPGAHVTVLGGGGYTFAPYNHGSVYWNISKISLKTTQIGINTFYGMRAVATEITNYPGGCAGIGGQSGAIAGDNYLDAHFPGVVGGGMKFYGNYIHDFGCDATSKLHHVFYISHRGGASYGPQQSYELGWNYLANNKAFHALHIYDEGVCGDFTGVLGVHDNVVVNQTGVGFGVASGGSTAQCFTMPVHIYNNLFVNIGLSNVGDTAHSYAMGLSGLNNYATVKIYNNTFQGFGDPAASGSGFFSDMAAGSGGIFPGQWEMVNNIIVNTNNIAYLDQNDAFIPPNVHSHNLWYNPNAGGVAAPAWDTAPLTSDPMFVDARVGGSFGLQAASPARGAGADTSSAVARDFLGLGRLLPYSIGAFEFRSASSLAPAAPRGLRTQP